MSQKSEIPYKIKPILKDGDRQKLNKYSDIVAHLLYHRDITDNSSAEKFINADYSSGLHDPFLLKDIDIAINRILLAIFEDQKICIYSDYDADGIPGAVILSDFFRKINFKNFFVYIPHRNKEGFGLNKEAIEKISEQNTKLIITIDCGISDVEQIALASKKDIDVVVTDHHDPNDHKSKAVAVINPRQPDCKYPDKNICGSGVIFKVVHALIKKYNQKISTIQKKDLSIDLRGPIHEGYEKWLLDMVGIATLSDMVPLVGENRVFAKYGLLVMKKSPRKGFVRLLRECRISQNNLNEDDVGFSISPRINAASRMDEPETAYKMLFTDDDVEADMTVRHLHKINDERKGKVAAMVKEIKKFLEDSNFDWQKSGVIVKGNPKWQPSLLGLAASSIVDFTKKPVFLWGRGEGKNFKGSCRSNGMVNLVEMMNAVTPGKILEFGGHKMAGGFVVCDDAIFDLEEELEKAYHKSLNGDLANEIVIDYQISLDDLSWNFFNDIDKLAPFGVGNEKPIFLISNVKVLGLEKFGKNKEHLKILLKKTNGENMNAIKFFAADLEKIKNIEIDKTIDIVASLEKSTFGGRKELRLRILDVL